MTFYSIRWVQNNNKNRQADNQTIENQVLLSQGYIYNPEQGNIYIYIYIYIYNPVRATLGFLYFMYIYPHIRTYNVCVCVCVCVF